MKIILIQPPIQDFYSTPIRTQPIGLSYIKALILKHFPNIQIKIFDFLTPYNKKLTISLPKSLKYLRLYYKYPDLSPFKTFYHYYHFGLSFDEIKNLLLKEKDALVAGVSCNFTPYYLEALRVAEIIKEINPNICTVFGGSHVSCDPYSVLKDPNVDFVVLKEGEYRFLELIKILISCQFNLDLAKVKLTEVDGIGFKDKDQTPVINKNLNFAVCLDNQNLDNLPFPNLEFENAPAYTYKYNSKPMCIIISSRGCPYSCSFCAVHTTFGNKYRRRSNVNILDEIKLRYNQGYRVFDFEDDNLTVNKKAFIELCDKLYEYFGSKDKNIELYAMNGICYDNLDLDILKSMKKAGFRQLNLSLVSANTSVCETANRSINIKKFLYIVNESYKLGFKIIVYYIVGLPYDTLDNMIYTMCFCAHLPVTLGISIFYPVPSTTIMKYLGEQKGSSEEYIKYRLTAMYYECENFSREDLYTLFVTSRIFNFLKAIKLKLHSKVLDEIKYLDVSNLSIKDKIGVELLNTLNQSKILYAYTKDGLKVLDKFKSELFFKILKTLDEVTINGLESK